MDILCCFAGVRTMIRNTGIPVKNKLLGFYIVLKSNNPCLPPATATIMFNRKEIILNCDPGIGIAKNTATSLT